MPLLINDSVVIEDAWRPIDDCFPIDSQARVILNFERLQKEWNRLLDSSVSLGLELEPGRAVEELLPFLERLQIVFLKFETFADGRAFSQARLLRDRYSYHGDIRAIGEVLCDQLCFMRRCGFNQFQLSENEDIGLAFSSFGYISVSYQSELKQILPC
jgi:uncharacterized protein (DUF934 family)